MNKITIGLFLLLFVGVSSYAQKKSGTLYAEHETIDLTRELWKAFADGDQEKYASYFADSVVFISNGDYPDSKTAKEKAGKQVKWWKENFVNLEIADHKPAFPDALEYKDGGTWVQDWLLVSARHSKSGINMKLALHNMYRFNDEGKIDLMDQHFNNNIFEEIRSSETTKGNGKVYINHPHIATVRKAINAYMDRNVDDWAEYFSPDARFGHYGLEFGKTMSYEENMKEMKEGFASDAKVSVEEVGYPDCIYYEKSGQYVIYSWWKVMKKTDDGKEVYGVMLTHNIDDDGKIVFEDVNLTSKRSK